MTSTEQQYKQKITLGSPGNALMILIAICLIVFVGLAFMKAVWFFKYTKEVALGYYYRDVCVTANLEARCRMFLSGC